MSISEITAYQCPCGKAYLDKNVALECCIAPIEKHCKCGAKISKSQWRCDECKDRADALHWECAERGPATSDQLLYSEWADDYISDDPEDFIDRLELEEAEHQEVMDLPLSELARKYQIYVCKPRIPRPINLSETYESSCFEDQELPGNWEAAEQAIEDWINSVEPSLWPQYPTKIAWNGSVVQKVEATS
jgi:hypothetical protein